MGTISLLCSCYIMLLLHILRENQCCTKCCQIKLHHSFITNNYHTWWLSSRTPSEGRQLSRRLWYHTCCHTAQTGTPSIHSVKHRAVHQVATSLGICSEKWIANIQQYSHISPPLSTARYSFTKCYELNGNNRTSKWWQRGFEPGLLRLRWESRHSTAGANKQLTILDAPLHGAQ